MHTCVPFGETAQGKLFSCLQFETLRIGCPRTCWSTVSIHCALDLRIWY